MSAKIDRLRQKQKQIGERIRTIEAKGRKDERKRDTRRKVLLGALLQRWMERDPVLRVRVEEALPAFLSRAVDREVFGLGDTVNAASPSHGPRWRLPCVP